MLARTTQGHSSSSATSEEQALLLQRILGSVISKDLQYQKPITPRPGRNKPNLNNGSDDPRASFLRRYSLESQPTGHPAFNELYKQLGQLINSPSVENFSQNPTLNAAYKGNLNYLNSLRQQWETNHPGQTFFPVKPAPGSNPKTTQS